MSRATLGYRHAADHIAHAAGPRHVRSKGFSICQNHSRSASLVFAEFGRQLFELMAASRWLPHIADQKAENDEALLLDCTLTTTLNLKPRAVVPIAEQNIERPAFSNAPARPGDPSS